SHKVLPGRNFRQNHLEICPNLESKNTIGALPICGRYAGAENGAREKRKIWLIFMRRSCQEKPTLFANAQNLLITRRRENSFAFVFFFVATRQNKPAPSLGGVKLSIEDHGF